MRSDLAVWCTRLAVVLLAAGCSGRVAPVAAASSVARSGSPVANAEVRDVPRRGADGSFPATFASEGVPLACNGTGLCEWGVLGLDLYEAALYCERRVASFAAAVSQPQRIVVHLHFVRSLSAEQLGAAFRAAARVNAGARLGEHEGALEQLCAAMRPVRAGDTFTFFCDPEGRIDVVCNGEVVSSIVDAPFRRLFVQMYLGENPPTKALRDGLLGR